MVIYCTVRQVSYLKDHFNWRIRYSSVHLFIDLPYSVSGVIYHRIRYSSVMYSYMGILCTVYQASGLKDRIHVKHFSQVGTCT